MWRALILLYIFLLSSVEADAQNISWYAYNPTYESYVPVISPTNKMSFFLKKDQARQQLNITFPGGSAMFIENKLIHLNNLKLSENLSFSVDSIFSIYSKDSIFISFYSEDILNELDVSITTTNTLTPDSQNFEIRAYSSANDINILLLIVSLILLGIWKNQSNIHAVGYLDVGLLFTSKSRDNTMYNTSYFQLDNVQFFSVLSLILSMIFLYLRYHVPYLVFYLDDSTILQLFISWIINAAFYYIVFYLKFVAVGVISQIFNFRNFKYVHFYDFIRFIYLSVLVYLIITIIDFISQGWLFDNLFYTMLLLPAVLILAHIFITFQKLNKLYSNRKLHLFSYLCVTEIIPIVLIIKISR